MATGYFLCSRRSISSISKVKQKGMASFDAGSATRGCTFIGGDLEEVRENDHYAQ
mgnify:CR=1 FL=1